jgi:hypothetical protein
MYCFLAQDWLTVRGQQTGITSVTQGEPGWLDLGVYQDVVAWLEVKEFNAPGGTLKIAYQTSPTKDEFMFVPITGPLTANTMPFALALGVTVTPLLKDTLTNPLARWFRWQLSVTGTLTGPWDATYRLFVAANYLGARDNPLPAATLTRLIPMSPSPPLHLMGRGPVRLQV